MGKTEQLQLIDRAFHALPDMHHGFTTEKDRLFQKNLLSETRYRRGDGRKHGISKQVAARLFTVRYIATALDRKAPLWTVKDILTIRDECIHAQALAETYRHEILTAWKAAGVSLADLKRVNYVTLMEEGRA